MQKSSVITIHPTIKLGIATKNNTLLKIILFPTNISPSNSPDAFTQKVIDQLQEYFSNPRFQFNLPCKPCGTDFQNKVWDALKKIPAGKTLTYGELAKKLGSAPRAVGQACRQNPLPNIVPCHRVIAKNHIGGYSGDTQGELLSLKKFLLNHEQAL